MSDSLSKFTLPDVVQAEQAETPPPGGPVRVRLERIAAAVWLKLVQNPQAVWAALPGLIYALAILYIRPSLYAFFIVGWARLLLFDLPLLGAGVAGGWFGVKLGQRRLNNPHMGGSAAFALWLFLALLLTFTVLVLTVDTRLS